MNQESNRAIRMRPGVQLIGLLLLAVVFVGALPLSDSNDRWRYLLFVVPVAVVSMFAFSFVANVGQACGAWLTGMRLVHVWVGPLLIQRRLSGLVLLWRPNTTPTLHVMSSTRRQRFQLLGPSLGLLLALVLAAALTLLAALRMLASVEMPFTALNEPGLVAQFAIVLVFFLVIFWPVTLALSLFGESFTSLQHLDRRDTPVDQRYWGVREIERLSYAGVRPRDWDDGWVAALAIPIDLPMISWKWTASQQAHAHMLAALSALDRGQGATAFRLCGEALATLSPMSKTKGLRSTILYWQATIAALDERDASRSRRLLNLARGERQPLERHIGELAHAAVALLEANPEECFRRVMRALDEFPKAVNPGSAHLELDLLERVVAESSGTWSAVQHADAVAGLAQARELLDRVVRERSTADNTPGRFRLVRMAPRMALVAVALLVVASTPVIAGRQIVDLRADDGSIYTRPAQWGAGSDIETVAALLATHDMPDGWHAERVDDAYWFRNGPALACSPYALFEEGQVSRYARGALDYHASGSASVRQVITQTDEGEARAALDRLRADRDCEYWDDASSAVYVSEPLDGPDIGDESVAYSVSSDRDSDDTISRWNVVFSRVGGTIISVVHGQRGTAPDRDQTYELARVATSKVATASVTWMPVEPERNAANDRVAEVMAWGGGFPAMVGLPLFMYFYVFGAWVVCAMLAARVMGNSLRFVVLVPVIVSRNVSGYRLSLRWMRPWATTPVAVGSVPPRPLTDDDLLSHVDAEQTVTIRVLIAAAIGITLAIVAVTIWLESRWIWSVGLFAAPGMLAACVLTMRRQRSRLRHSVAVSDPSMRHYCAHARVLWSSIDGVRPRDWDADDVRMLTDDTYGATGASALQGLLLAHVALLDREEIEQARDALGRALSLLAAMRPEHVGTVLRSLVFRNAAWFAARHDGDAVAARRWLNLAVAPSIERYDNLLVEGSVLAAEGAVEQARAAIEQSLCHVGDAISTGEAVFAAEEARLLLAELQQPPSPPTPWPASLD